MLRTAEPMTALPDPHAHPACYDGVATKRLIAWGVDVVAISLLTLVALPFTLFLGLFFLPILYLFIGFFYRWASLARGSATPGMRLTGIRLEDAGGMLDPTTAFLHVAGHTTAVILFPLQFVSAGVAGVTEKRQTLTDLLLGTTALNR